MQWGIKCNIPVVCSIASRLRRPGGAAGAPGDGIGQGWSTAGAEQTMPAWQITGPGPSTTGHWSVERFCRQPDRVLEGIQAGYGGFRRCPPAQTERMRVRSLEQEDGLLPERPDGLS